MAGLLTTNCVTVAEPSAFATTLPSGANVTVVAAAGVIVSTALGEPSSCARLWTTTPVPTSVTVQAVAGPETNCTGTLRRIAAARATCRPLRVASLAARNCWFCSHSLKFGSDRFTALQTDSHG